MSQSVAPFAGFDHDDYRYGPDGPPRAAGASFAAAYGLRFGKPSGKTAKLLTLNRREFDRVAGLMVTDWCA